MHTLEKCSGMKFKKVNRVRDPLNNPTASKIVAMALVGYGDFKTFKEYLDLSDRSIYHYLNKLEKEKLLKVIPFPENQKTQN